MGVGMEIEYKTLMKMVNGIFSFLQPPEYPDTNNYGSDLGKFPEDEAKKILRIDDKQVKQVLGLYMGDTDKILLTDNPLNKDKVVRDYVTFHELGHKIYKKMILKDLSLKDIYPDEETFCDLYALGEFSKKYGKDEIKKIIDIGLVTQGAIEMYKNMLKKS